MRSGAAGAILLGTGLIVVVAVRLASGPAAHALAEAARRVRPAGDGPSLLVLVDPGCPACAQAREDLRFEIRPRDLGLAVRVVERGDPEAEPLFRAVGFGLLPAYVLLDAGGRPVALLRGARSPPAVRSWLERELARTLGEGA